MGLEIGFKCPVPGLIGVLIRWVLGSKFGTCKDSCARDLQRAWLVLCHLGTGLNYLSGSLPTSGSPLRMVLSIAAISCLKDWVDIETGRKACKVHSPAGTLDVCRVQQAPKLNIATFSPSDLASSNLKSAEVRLHVLGHWVHLAFSGVPAARFAALGTLSPNPARWSCKPGMSHSRSLSICLPIYLSIYLSIHLSISTCVHMYVNICLFIYVISYTCVYVYTYTHTQSFKRETERDRERESERK